MFRGGFYRFFSSSLQLFVRKSTSCQAEYHTYPDNKVRVMLTNLTQNRHFGTGSKSTGIGDKGLYGVLPIGKSSKKAKPQRIYFKQTNLAENENKTAKFENTKVKKQRAKVKKSPETIISKEKPNSSFLSSLSNKRTTQLKSQQIAEGWSDAALASLATNRLYSKTTPKSLESFSVDKDEMDVVLNMDAKDTRMVDLNRLDLDLVGGDTWIPSENCWTHGGLQLEQIGKGNKKSGYKIANLGKEDTSGNSGYGVKGAKNINGKVDRKEFREEMSFEGRKCLLYDELGYRNNIGNTRNDVSGDSLMKSKSPDVIVTVLPSITNGSNLSLSKDSTVPTKEDGSNQHFVGPLNKTDSQNGFILIDEDHANCLNKEIENVDAVTFGQDVDVMIQTLQNDKWEKLVQKKFDQMNETSHSKRMHKDRLSVNYEREIPISEYSDENICFTGHSKMEGSNDIFGKAMMRQAKSSVPNNTSNLPTTQVCIGELKPNHVDTEMVYRTKHSRDGGFETKSKSEPILIVQPNEIKNRKQQTIKRENDKSHALHHSKELDMTEVQPIILYPAPSRQHGRKEIRSGDSLPKLNDKDEWSKRLLSAVQNEKKKSLSEVELQPRKQPEIDWSSEPRKQPEIDWSSAAARRWLLKKERLGKKAREVNSVEKSKSVGSGNGSNKTTDVTSNLVNGETNRSVFVKKTKKSKKVSSKKSELKRQLREQWVAELREKFLQMERDKLLKMCLTSNTNGYAKWVAETLEQERTIKPDYKKASNQLQAPKCGFDQVDKQPRNKGNNLSTLCDGNCHDDVHLDAYEKWATRQDDLYHKEMVQRKVKKTKAKPKTSTNPSTGNPVACIENTSTAKSDKFKAFKFDPNIESIINRLNRSSGIDSKGMFPLSTQQTVSNSICISNARRILDKMDGLMTMTLEPVVDPPTPITSYPVAMAIPTTSSNVPVPTYQNPNRNLTTTNQNLSSKSKNHQTFDEIQLQRHLLAMRRYNDRVEKEKEEKKKKKKKKRNERGYTRMRKNIWPEQPNKKTLA